MLHIDPTVDRTLPTDAPVPIELVVERTLELIGHAEAERQRLGQPPISYEVGTEEVHGGLVDLDSFTTLHRRVAPGAGRTQHAACLALFHRRQGGYRPPHHRF